MSEATESIHWTELAPTVAALYTNGVLHAALYDQLSARQVAELEDRLTGSRRAREPHVTQLISFLDGHAEAAFVRLMCERAGVAYHPELRVISGGEFHADTGATGRRTVDLVIVDTAQPGRQPVIAIEAKFDASVNGKRFYCTDPAHAAYSNQIICYPSGCIHPALTADTVRFVWLGRLAHRDLPMSRFTGAINDRDTDLAEARALQDRAEQQWARATWEEVWEAMARAIPGRDRADAVLRGLRSPSDWSGLTGAVAR